MYDYTKRIRWARLKVGILFTMALLILFMVIMFAGNIGQLFAHRVMIYGTFNDVSGLKVGSPVMFSGVEIGSVTAINFMQGPRVEVILSVDRGALRYLRKDSGMTIRTFGLLGDKYVEIGPGSEEAPTLEPRETLAGKPPIEIQDILRSSAMTVERLSRFMLKLQEILDKIGTEHVGEGTVAKLLNEPTVYDQLKEITEGITQLVEGMESGKGTLGMLLRDDTLYRDLTASSREIKLFAETLRDSKGSLHRFIKDAALYERFLRASEALDKFTERLATSRGTIQSLIEDKNLYNNLNSAAERLDRILKGIDRGEGLMGAFLRDHALAEDLKTTLRELKSLIKDIRENPHRYLHFTFL